MLWAALAEAGFDDLPIEYLKPFSFIILNP